MGHGGASGMGKSMPLDDMCEARDEVLLVIRKVKKYFHKFYGAGVSMYSVLCYRAPLSV